MTVYIATLLVLCVIAFFISIRTRTSSSVIKNGNFKKLQSQYLKVYYLATFSDWLQGPYVYKLYSDYGYDDNAIAVLYIVGFISSCFFGMVVGHAADRYGRKFLCSSFGILYTLCCLTKVSSQFYILFVGRVFGGISTSILFSTFEAWYVNEHLNYYKLPPEWMNVTFSKAAFYTGLLAIIAGIVSQFVAETLHMGPVYPFLLAIPALLTSTYFIVKTWDEHPPEELKEEKRTTILSSLNLICCKEILLLLLCFIQSLYESVMYIFIFSWTPILSTLDPPLGLVFSIFMIAFMIGTKIYSLLIAKRFRSQDLLTITCAIGFISYTTITIIVSLPLFLNEHSLRTLTQNNITVYLCFLSFVLYEMSIGIYFPAIGYIRGRVIPEKYRASVTNWFRLPMNVFTCIGLILKRGHKTIDIRPTESPIYEFENNKFPVIFISCTVFLAVTTLISILFGRMYMAKLSKINGSKILQSKTNMNDVIKLETGTNETVHT